MAVSDTTLDPCLGGKGATAPDPPGRGGGERGVLTCLMASICFWTLSVNLHFISSLYKEVRDVH